MTFGIILNSTIYLIMNCMTSIIQVLVVFLVQRQYSIQMIPEQDVGQVLKKQNVDFMLQINRDVRFKKFYTKNIVF